MLDPTITDLRRRLDNLFRLGTIAEIDYRNAKVRVKSGDILTDWLPWFTCRAGKSKTWSPPTVDEQCLILAISGELTTALVLTGLYTLNAPSQRADEHCFTFEDGAEIKYNHTSGHLSALNCKTAVIHAKEHITVDTKNVICTGNMQIKGSLNVTGTISTTKNITATGDISGKGISLSTHTHKGVDRGNQKTDAPSS